MERLRGFPRSAITFETPPSADFLKHKVEIYIPANDWKDELIYKMVFKKFCEVFGGATATMVKGGLIDVKGELVINNIVIVHSFVKSINNAVRKIIRQQAHQVQVVLDQDAVTVVLDNRCQFIEREDIDTEATLDAYAKMNYVTHHK